jgi:Cft2 family RNA processing exonuclease
MTGFDVVYSKSGLHLPQLGLWLDAQRRQSGTERVFVSHAHSDHIGRHSEVILTPATAALMQARLGGKRCFHSLAFDRPTRFDGPEQPFEITLLPAGHIFGSAMAWVEAGGQSLLYTGDFKLRPSFSAETCTPRPADVLIMETTFGRPEYLMPPTEQVGADIVKFCLDSIRQGAVPILRAYALGKSQELIHWASQTGRPVCVHSSIHELALIYAQHGHLFPPYKILSDLLPTECVIICPPQVQRIPGLTSTTPVRTAVVTGWAINPSCRYQFKCDAAFPLSDHADFNDLIALVDKVKPRKVYTVHGFASPFAQYLRRQGVDAYALSEPDQLELNLV